MPIIKTFDFHIEMSGCNALPPSKYLHSLLNFLLSNTQSSPNMHEYFCYPPFTNQKNSLRGLSRHDKAITHPSLNNHT